jgi:hypothetical protein
MNNFIIFYGKVFPIIFISCFFVFILQLIFINPNKIKKAA